MAFEEISGATEYPKYKDFNAGDVIVEGYYKGVIDGKYGDQYKFTKPNGTDVILSKAGHLAYLLEKVSEGDLTRVTYGGTDTLDKGPFAGKEVHRFSVAVDREASKSGDAELPF